MNRKLLAVAVSGALAAPMSVQAVKYKLSGQVNRAIVYNDDGAASDVQFVDNISSGTRWRMTGSEEIGNGMKVGFNWEWQNSTNPSTSTPIKSGNGAGAGSQNMRKAEVWFSGNWGKLSLGKGDGAGNGATEVDLSQTWNVTYVARASFSGAVAWRTGAGGTIAGGLTHGNTFSQFDAFSRYDRVRYDSPALGPITLAASMGQNSQWEVAARLSSGIAGGELSAAVFYGATEAPPGGAGVKSRYGGSASYLFSQGTNITAAYASNEPEGAGAVDASNWYVKLGHNWGNNSASVSYGASEDVIPGYTDSGFQIGFNHNIPKAQVDLYAGYLSNELDTPAGVPSVDLSGRQQDSTDRDGEKQDCFQGDLTRREHACR